jgi:hypothetical protein
MKRSICLGAAALCLAAFSVSEAVAQHCQPYWTAEYKCMNGCGCPGGGVAPPQPAGPAPEVLALQRARARMVAVIESVSSALPFFDRNSWMADLPSTPRQFISDADLLHGTLAAQSVAFQRQGERVSRHHRPRQPRRSRDDAAGAGGTTGYRAAH